MVLALKFKMAPSDTAFLQQISDHLYQNIDDPSFSIDFLCQKLNISRSHLHRKIKASSGLSTSLYIRHLRLLKAKDMLEHSSLNISEVAYSVGINSPQNFSKYFFKEFGYSPSDFRKSIKNKAKEIAPKHAPTISAKQRWKFSRSQGVIGLLIVLLSVLSITYVTNQSNAGTNHSNYENSVAILPFKVLEYDRYPHLSDALTEDIINQLATIKNLKTISRTSSFLYLDTSKSPLQIGKELGVKYLLEGSIQEKNDVIKLNVQLFKAADGTQVWSNSYHRKINDLFTLQQDLTDEIVFSLGSTIIEKDKFNIETSPTNNINAYSLLSQARHLIRTRKGKDLREAVNLCDSALVLDPEYADAYAYRATANFLLLELKYREDDISIAEIESDALKSLRYDEDNPQAYATLGNLYSYNYKWEQSKIALEIALENQPNNAIYNYWYSLTLRSLAQLDKSLEFNLKAKVLDPFHPVIHAGYIATSIYADRLDQAWQALEEDRSKFGDSFVYTWLQGTYYYLKEDYARALKEFEAALALNPGMKSVELSEICTYGKMGDKEKVMEYINTLMDDNPIDLHRKAVAYASMNDYKNGLHYFIKAAEKGFIASDFMVDQTYRPFKADPEMQKYLRRYDFVQ